MELGDPGKFFVWTSDATGANRFELPYSPVMASTMTIHLTTALGVVTDVTADVVAEEHTGVITFDTAPTLGDTITVQGTYFRYFTNAELTMIVDSSVKEHLYNRTDAFGRQLTVANLPIVEEFPAALLGTVQALHTLATDAAFDINISTPDGIAIPRGQRYGQLMDNIRARQGQYDDLCKALNIGLTRIEVFTFRRISKTTNRYIPIFVPQEVDDRSIPQRVFLPITTYGGSPVPSTAATYDLVFTQGDDFSTVLDFPFDLTGYTAKAQIRLYPESAAVVASIVCTVTDLAEGKLEISLPASITTKVPIRSYWDIQLTGPDPEEFTETYLRGAVFCVRQVTQDVP